MFQWFSVSGLGNMVQPFLNYHSLFNTIWLSWYNMFGTKESIHLGPLPILELTQRCWNIQLGPSPASCRRCHSQWNNGNPGAGWWLLRGEKAKPALFSTGWITATHRIFLNMVDYIHRMGLPFIPRTVRTFSRRSTKHQTPPSMLLADTDMSFL